MNENGVRSHHLLFSASEWSANIFLFCYALNLNKFLKLRTFFFLTSPAMRYSKTKKWNNFKTWSYTHCLDLYFMRITFKISVCCKRREESTVPRFSDCGLKTAYNGICISFLLSPLLLLLLFCTLEPQA